MSDNKDLQQSVLSGAMFTSDHGVRIWIPTGVQTPTRAFETHDWIVFAVADTWRLDLCYPELQFDHANGFSSIDWLARLIACRRWTSEIKGV